MITLDTRQINSSSLEGEIAYESSQALNLISAVKSHDADITEKQVQNLLIEYILAMMQGNTAEAAAILNKIGAVLENFGKEIHDLDKSASKVRKLDPHSPESLQYLSNLITDLRNQLG